MRVFVFKPRLSYGLAVIVVICLLMYPTVLQPIAQNVMAVVTGQRVLPIYRVDTGENKIAISFDATWGTDLTSEILDILDEYSVKTTFFVAGYWVDKYPEYVVEIARRGHELGNHSYSHPHMNSLTDSGIITELEKNHAMIVDLTGQEAFLFRPPFGEYNNKVIESAKSIGYYTIQWSIDSLDWKNTTSDQIYRRVMDGAGPGEIVLFHNAAKSTPDAIRRLIPDLQNQGYEIVPISALIYRDNFYMEHDGTQRQRKGAAVQ